SAGHSGDHVCNVDVHPCGMPCKLSGKRGCTDECVKLVQHEGEHVCSAPLHICDQPCDLIDLELLDGKSFTCPEKCRVPINEEHTVHACEDNLCPIPCQLCERLCSRDHLHGLSPSENHLCGQEHSCNASCNASGICQIDTTPQSIKATFAGRYKTFRYTKVMRHLALHIHLLQHYNVASVAKRLRCVKVIEPGAIEHDGLHIHSNEAQPFHYCESRCRDCDNFCVLPLGHAQREHETTHGTMPRTHWAVDRQGSCNELGGHKFSSKDGGALMMCNLVCSSMGRHVHIDDCRGDPHGPEAVHINERILPNPEQAKDLITHGLHWRLSFSVDPYTRYDQENFAKWYV
ncbi:hypothetical protein V8E53_008005, partial [Lactarius tabidus]